MIANTLDPKAFDFLRGEARGGHGQGRARGGLGRPLSSALEACIADDDEAAFDVMRRRVTLRVYLSQYPHWDYLKELGIELPRELIDIAEQKKPAGQAAKLMPRAVVESMVLGGGVERCAAQLARALDPRIQLRDGPTACGCGRQRCWKC